MQRHDAVQTVLQQIIRAALRQDHQQSVQTLQQGRQRGGPCVQQLQSHMHKHERFQHLHELIGLQQHGYGQFLPCQALRNAERHLVVLGEPRQRQSGEGIQRPRGISTEPDAVSATAS